MLDHREIQSIGIYSSTNKDEVFDIASQDPAVQAGRLIVAGDYEWFGISGSTLA